MNTKTRITLAVATVAAIFAGSDAFAQANRQANAIYIRDSASVTLNTSHPSGISDPDSTARANIVDTANCITAETSNYADPGETEVWLHSTLLSTMKSMVSTYGYTYRVTEIAGGDHSSTSYHYRGTAYDVSVINGSGVSSSNPYWSTFNQRNRNLGSIESLGPGDSGHSTHVHNAWPSGTANSGPGGCLPVSSVTVDNSNAGFSVTGTWATASSSTDKFGADYRYKSTAPISEPAQWVANVSGTKSVFAWWPQGSNRAVAAGYIVTHSGGTTTVNKNQQINGGSWQSLGTWSMTTGKVQLSCWTATGFIVVADAVKWQ